MEYSIIVNIALIDATDSRNCELVGARQSIVGLAVIWYNDKRDNHE